MKKRTKQWIAILIVIAAIYCYAERSTLLDIYVNSRMQAGLDMENADGDKLVAYYVDDDTYSMSYIPFAYQTSNPDDVGAILYITKEPVSQSYSGGLQVTANKLIVELIDADTGEVINFSSFSPLFPSRYRSGSAVVVDMDLVKDWVQEQWEAYLAQNG